MNDGIRKRDWLAWTTNDDDSRECPAICRTKREAETHAGPNGKVVRYDRYLAIKASAEEGNAPFHAIDIHQGDGRPVEVAPMLPAEGGAA